MTVERTAFNADGQLIDTGRHSTIPVDLVVRSVGYRGRPLGSVPFDEDRGVIPNSDGRVLDGDEPIPGLYVAGWIKRGPTGIIGTNKKCAVGTVGALYEDIDSGDLVPADRSADDDLVDALVDRGVSVVSTAGWRAVDAAERSRGDERGKDRLTVHERADLLRIAST